MCLLCTAAKLYLPKVDRSSGAVIDMWIKVHIRIFIYIFLLWLYIKHRLLTFHQARELDANTDYYLELLAKGTGKSKEEIEKDIQRPKYFRAQEAIDYGLADKIISSRDAAFEKRVRIILSYFHFVLTIAVLHFLQVGSNFTCPPIRIMMRCLHNQRPWGVEEQAHRLLPLDLGDKKNEKSPQVCMPKSRCPVFCQCPGVGHSFGA